MTIMNGQEFLRITKAAFAPFLKELGFAMEEPSISGRLYSARFTGSAHSISVSYEPGDDALFVIIFSREKGRLSDVDDHIKTPRLSDLNDRYMRQVTNEDRKSNDTFFESIDIPGQPRSSLLKAAKELRLVLPKYLETASSGL